MEKGIKISTGPGKQLGALHSSKVVEVDTYTKSEKYILTQMKWTGMKCILCIILLVVVVITAGCVGGNKGILSTPTPQIIYVTLTETPTPAPTLNIKTYCNDSRSILELPGAIPGSSFSGIYWTDKTTQTEKDKMYNMHRELIIDLENIRVQANDLNNDLLKDFPEVSRSQSCNWMVVCFNNLTANKCYEIPKKYRITYYDNHIIKYQDFPISQPIENDFNDNGLIKMIKI